MRYSLNVSSRCLPPADGQLRNDQGIHRPKTILGATRVATRNESNNRRATRVALKRACRWTFRDTATVSSAETRVLVLELELHCRRPFLVSTVMALVIQR